MRFPFDGLEAQKLNKDIFETIYFAALKTSCELATKYGTYSSYEGSPVSNGVSIVHFITSSLYYQPPQYLLY